jgi:hypothetical protein
MIKKVKGGYRVLSSKGKNMGGPYKTREEALKRPPGRILQAQQGLGAAVAGFPQPPENSQEWHQKITGKHLTKPRKSVYLLNVGRPGLAPGGPDGHRLISPVMCEVRLVTNTG